MDAKTWLKGLLAAIIGAAANGVLVVMVNPGTFDIFSVPGWKNIGTVCVASSLVAGALYLKQSPLPTGKSTTTTTTITKEEIKAPSPDQ